MRTHGQDGFKIEVLQKALIRESTRVATKAENQETGSVMAKAVHQDTQETSKQLSNNTTMNAIYLTT